MKSMGGKWKHIIAILLASSFVAGCVKSGVDGGDGVIRTYKAYLSPETRTAIDAEGNVSWTYGDYVWYYSTDGGLLRMYTVEEDASRIIMPLTIANDASYVVAVYGSTGISNYSREALSLANVVKPEQDGTFRQGHTAVSRITEVESETLPFLNIIGLISFSTERTDIDHVVFTSADDTPLHGNGDVNVSFVGDEPVGSFGSGTGNSITVNLSGAGHYFITTLPCNMASGFTLACYGADDRLIGTATGMNPLNLKRAHIMRLGNIDVRLVDESGIHLIDYGDDGNWDNDFNGSGNINIGGYYGDQNWDSGFNSSGNVNIGGYPGDENWDSRLC